MPLIFGFILPPGYEIDQANKKYGPMKIDKGQPGYEREFWHRFDNILDDTLHACRNVYAGVVTGSVKLLEGARKGESVLCVGFLKSDTAAGALTARRPRNYNHIVARFKEILEVDEDPQWYIEEHQT